MAEGKARLILLLAQIDQLAVDRGSAYSSLRRFVGGGSAILFLGEACPAGHIREPAHEVVASYVGRSIHVSWTILWKEGRS